MTFLRSTIFNLSFYGITAIACIICLPALLLSRKGVFVIIRAYTKSVYFLEKHILGLNYEVRGLENIPKQGSCIVAAKHQSAYETLKLHLLFDDPAVVLKQELLNIPIWGWFLARCNPIAIDRSQGRHASAQIVDGAKNIEKQNRPIVIFPQGTRVTPEQTTKDKPYKSGIIRMYQATNMPIVPMALNSGMFWPRGSWNKKSGTVIFEFLPAIETGRNSDKLLKELEKTLEKATLALQDEAEKENI